MHAAFDKQIEEAEAVHLRGWDFQWLNQRTREEGLPWDYREIVLERKQHAQALLDVGTGGGEFLSGLAPFPPLTWATEGYPPNVILARERLEPLGIHVADVSGIAGGRLPFDNATFDLIIDRHEGAPAAELARILKPGGRYITQQVGGENCMDLNRFLQGSSAHYAYADCTLDNLTRDLTGAGLQVISAREALPRWTFLDTAGIIFYLKAVPWQVDDFSVDRYRQQLLEIHRIIMREGGFMVKEHRLLIEAVKPSYNPG